MLPVRCDGSTLDRLIDGLIRGRSAGHVRESGFSSKGFEGAVGAARALGLIEPDEMRLTDVGRAFGLAEGRARAALLEERMRGFAPYAALIDDVAAGRLSGETEADWVSRRWAAEGWGSSESNRAEGVSTFARLAEAASLAEFVPGRRGHPTRIRWRVALDGHRGRGGEPRRRVEAAAEAAPAATASAPPAPPHDSAERAVPADDPLTTPEPASQSSAHSEVVFVLSPGRVARLEVPSALTVAEKQRLLTLLDVLVRTEPPG